MAKGEREIREVTVWLERLLGMLNVDKNNPIERKKIKVYKTKGISTYGKGWNSSRDLTKKVPSTRSEDY